MYAIYPHLEPKHLEPKPIGLFRSDFKATSMVVSLVKMESSGEYDM